MNHLGRILAFFKITHKTTQTLKPPLGGLVITP